MMVPSPARQYSFPILETRARATLGNLPLPHLQFRLPWGAFLGLANKSITYLQTQELVWGWVCESKWHNLGTFPKITERKSPSVFQWASSIEHHSIELLAATLPLKRRPWEWSGTEGNRSWGWVGGTGPLGASWAPAADSKPRPTITTLSFAFCLN